MHNNRWINLFGLIVLHLVMAKHSGIEEVHFVNDHSGWLMRTKCDHQSQTFCERRRRFNGNVFRNRSLEEEKKTALSVVCSYFFGKHFNRIKRYEWTTQKMTETIQTTIKKKKSDQFLVMRCWGNMDEWKDRIEEKGLEKVKIITSVQLNWWQIYVCIVHTATIDFNRNFIGI